MMCVNSRSAIPPARRCAARFASQPILRQIDLVLAELRARQHVLENRQDLRGVFSRKEKGHRAVRRAHGALDRRGDVLHFFVDLIAGFRPVPPVRITIP